MQGQDKVELLEFSRLLVIFAWGRSQRPTSLSIRGAAAVGSQREDRVPDGGAQSKRRRKSRDEVAGGEESGDEMAGEEERGDEVAGEKEESLKRSGACTAQYK